MRRLAGALVLAACGTAPSSPARTLPPAPAAWRAMGDVPVVDLHVDLAYAATRGSERLDDPASEVSAGRLALGGARRVVVPLFVADAFAMSPDAARAAYDGAFASLSRALGRTPVAPAVTLSFEGADGFADDPAGFDAWAARGACLVGLVHSHTNALGASSQDPVAASRAHGLTPAGWRLAQHVVAHGALLDLAHASDATQDDLVAVARAAGAPIVDSHTGMRALVASERNLDDAHARAIAASGGVLGMSMHSGHLARSPGERATLDELVAHLEHAVAVAGEAHVALGSDLAGAIRQPAGADGAATWPALVARLRSRGWSDTRLHAVFHANAERVFSWAVAHGCTPRDVRPARDLTRRRR